MQTRHSFCKTKSVKEIVFKNIILKYDFLLPRLIRHLPVLSSFHLFPPLIRADVGAVTTVEETVVPPLVNPVVSKRFGFTNQQADGEDTLI